MPENRIFRVRFLAYFNYIRHTLINPKTIGFTVLHSLFISTYQRKAIRTSVF